MDKAKGLEGIIATAMAKAEGSSDDQLGQMSWDELIELRKTIDKDHKIQQRLAPFEHRAWAREQVADNPLTAPAYALMVPGYQLAKAAGAVFDSGQTPPTWDQMKQGLLGVGEGLARRFK